MLTTAQAAVTAILPGEPVNLNGHGTLSAYKAFLYSELEKVLQCELQNKNNADDGKILTQFPGVTGIYIQLDPSPEYQDLVHGVGEMDTNEKA